jgi:hypothetical protein
MPAVGAVQIHMSGAHSTNFEVKGLLQLALQARACRKHSAVRSLTVSSQHTHSMLHNMQAGIVHTMQSPESALHACARISINTLTGYMTKTCTPCTQHATATRCTNASRSTAQ